LLDNKAGDPPAHLTACHFPVEAGEDLADAVTRRAR
jgi:hypothetical protein